MRKLMLIFARFLRLLWLSRCEYLKDCSLSGGYEEQESRNNGGGLCSETEIVEMTSMLLF